MSNIPIIKGLADTGWLNGLTVEASPATAIKPSNHFGLPDTEKSLAISQLA